MAEFLTGEEIVAWMDGLLEYHSIAEHLYSSTSDQYPRHWCALIDDEVWNDPWL